MEAEVVTEGDTFTQEELDDNWNWLLERKQIIEDFTDRDKPPTPFQYRSFEKECGRGTPNACEFLALCDSGAFN